MQEILDHFLNTSMKELRKLEGKREKGKSIGERAPWTWKLEAEDIEKSIEQRHPEAPFWPRTESQGSVAVVGGAGIGRFYDLVTLRKQLETLVRNKCFFPYSERT